MKLLILTILAVSITFASATCPNLCNGRGKCGQEDRCTCFGNWKGADCSERVCSYGLAWVDAPSETNKAHWYAECSNKGVCDRSTGICACYEGYTGKGCRRSTCPNDCSGHGTCYFIEQLSSLDSKFIVDYDNMETFNTWDKSKIQGCVCDPYYEGTDCSLRQCPRGDNTLTLGDVPTVQSITIEDAEAANGTPTGEITLTFVDLYGGSWETEPITVAGAGADHTGIATALKALPNRVIEDIACTAGGAVTNGYAVDCTFTSVHNSGVQNLLKVNYKGCSRAGCTPMYTGLITGADDASVGTVTAVVSDITTANSHKEAAVCSEHGICDTETGLCSCFSGYYDEDCSQQTVLV